jgi:hypothetical protein
MSDYIEWDALVDVLTVGLVIGAGLPALFALGVRALAGPGSRNFAGRMPRTRIVVATACFSVIFGAIFSAILIIGSGSPH